MRAYKPALLLGTVAGSVRGTAQASRRGPRHVEAGETETERLLAGRAEGTEAARAQQGMGRAQQTGGNRQGARLTMVP